MSDKQNSKSNRPQRGAPYSLEEFQQKHDLTPEVAQDLFARFGPSAIELDLLMSAKRKVPSLAVIAKDFEL